ncbi:nucleoporin (NUP54/57), putative [Trypanosoma brucei brucei TREU927]|uniref:Nucleoporin (NUP54/57), putative n=1 Tax=Trypanosoma brucei brucei (strain 927/4 GUTat10.1) TaxID=185431 RepID=Q584I6_TRYB2|nr:nucleoporin (NUP54/57), putative [Trypanosoma brucei brucei TREU927]AAX80565.1 nucleoporin (NUP54/57), putative [Trypanosoma brucei]AAZ11109.1 nucleoporin (NUP54/57), putative [Trypanosoma brucei brucei TREU927]
MSVLGSGFGRGAPGGFGAPACSTAGGFGSGFNTATTGGFGAGANTATTGGFGAGANTATTGGFGAGANTVTTGGFGAGANTATTGGFGAGANTVTTGGFGAGANTATTGGFGAGANTATTGGFGAGANTATTGGFGAGANTATTGGFGAGANTATTGGFGAGANTATTGGFGAGANTVTTGGFGAGANTATTGGFGAGANTATTGGFGAGANTVTTGGFGAGANTATTGGFGAGANTVTTGGFGAGANTATTGGFGAGANTATTGGFGAGANTATTGGFGAGANTATTGGFGAGANTVTTGGFGAGANTATTGGFGSGFNTAGGLGSGGFGAGPNTAGGFGTASVSFFGSTAAGAESRPNAVGASQQQVINCQSAVGRYLLEIDHAYNAMHPNCRFRSFLYNVCAPGQSIMAVERERLIYAAAGGECKEEDLLRAQQRNPDPVHLYPTRVHFMQELKNRVEKQKEILEAMSRHVDSLATKADHFRELDEANAAQYRELQQEQAMLQRRWYSLLMKVETLRQLGLPLAEESRMGGIASTLSAQLSAPGMYKTALTELQPFLDAESSTITSFLRRNSVGGSEGAICTPSEGVGTLRNNRVDQALLRDWARFAERIQQCVEGLSELLERDAADMRAIYQRVASS